jgi:hypothetical protein
MWSFAASHIPAAAWTVEWLCVSAHTNEKAPDDARGFSAAPISKALIDEADAWAAASNVGRSEAIRALVALGLKAKTKG